MEMRYVRIKSYYGPDYGDLSGKFTSCEHIYWAENQYKALEYFRAEYPEHKDCILIAEDYDPQEHQEHFKVCKECGCVHECFA